MQFPVANKIDFRLEAKDGIFVESVYLVLTKDGEQDVYYQMNYGEKEGGVSVFDLSLKIDDAGLYWYKFVTNTELGSFEFGKNEYGELLQNGEAYQLTIYDGEFAPIRQSGGVVLSNFCG